MPFNSMPIMCLSVCEPAKFELQEIKRGEYFHVSMDTQGFTLLPYSLWSELEIVVIEQEGNQW